MAAMEKNPERRVMADCTHWDFKPERQPPVAKEPFNSRYGSPFWQLAQLLDSADANQGAHLRNRDGVQLRQSLRCCKPLMDQNRVDALHIGQYDQLFQRRDVTHVAGLVGIGLPPLSGRHAEQCDVEQIGFAGIDGGGLRFG